MGPEVILSMLLFAPPSCGPPILDAAGAERRRIRRHLSEVESRLRAADTSHLSPQQQQRRTTALDRLHDYLLEGDFPRNRDHPHAYNPYFIDEGGTACAVADLMLASGDVQLAQRVGSNHNQDFLGDMKTPGLAEWATAMGFTAQELAAIQPAYCSCEDSPDFDPVCGEDGITYWNRCVAAICGGMNMVHAGECENPTAQCALPFVVYCGNGVTDGLCVPEGGPGAHEASLEDAMRFLEGEYCPPTADADGCAGCRANRGSLGWTLVLLLSCGRVRRRR